MGRLNRWFWGAPMWQRLLYRLCLGLLIFGGGTTWRDGWRDGLVAGCLFGVMWIPLSIWSDTRFVTYRRAAGDDYDQARLLGRKIGKGEAPRSPEEASRMDAIIAARRSLLANGRPVLIGVLTVAALVFAVLSAVALVRHDRNDAVAVLIPVLVLVPLGAIVVFLRRREKGRLARAERAVRHWRSEPGQDPHPAH